MADKQDVTKIEYSYYYSQNLLTKITIAANKDKITVKSKDLLGERTTSFTFDQLSKRITYGKRGDRELTKTGIIIIFFIWFISYPLEWFFKTLSGNPTIQITEAILLSLGSLFIFLSIVIKREYVSFHEKNDSNAGFSIVYSRHNRESAQKLINHIQDKISKK